MAAVNHAVLIVDDEEHVLRSIKRLLRRDGYEIHLADGGHAALGILKSQEIAVIICDQRMPGMPGAEVLAQSYKLRPDTVRIALTGYTDLTAAQASINEGRVNHLLLKPWDDDHLRSVLREGVRAYQMIQDNRRLEGITRRQKEELEAWNHRLEEQVEQRTEQLSTQNNQLRGLQKQLEQSLRDTVGVMIGMLEANNPNIGIHSKRVAQLAHTLAAELDLAGQDLRDAEFAAHLHDIGKVSKIEGERASRAGRATRAKGHAALRHSDSGHAILSHVAGFEGIAAAVRHQHEHYDGSGYPDRMQGDEIPLASRIIAIVNSYDEAVFSSTYPTSASREAGRKVLLQGQGKRLDPALVDMFLEYLNKDGAHTCDDSEVALSPGQLKVGMKLSRALRNAEGVLLLKPGTALTAENIERIEMASNIDPVLSGVFVRCTGEAASPDVDQQHGVPDDEASVGSKTVPSRSTTDSGETSTRQLDGGSPSEMSAGPVTRRPARAEGSDSPSGQEGHKRPRVLIVDDVVMLCNALKRELRTAGLDAVATHNGHEAIELVQGEKFDVVITDVIMPVMGGEELIRRLGKLAPKLPCIVLTGNARVDEVRRIAKAPNVVGILVKPWDKNRLMDALESALAGRTHEPAKAP